MTLLPLVVGLVSAVGVAGLDQHAAILLDSMEEPALYTPAQPELGHKWTGTVELDTAEAKEGAGCLRFHVNSAKSGSESYPQWGRPFDAQTSDWRRFGALRYWVKVVSESPKVTHKAMCIVVYNGDSPLQQFKRHLVPVGEWVQLTDNILNYQRDRVRGIVIYLYETNPDIQDSYTWWIDGLELVGLAENAYGFDNLVVTGQRAPTQAPLREVVSGDGLRLVLDGRGRVASVCTTAGALSPTGPEVLELTGLLIRDWRREERPQPVEGELGCENNTVTQRATVRGLQVQACYEGQAEQIRCRITVRDTDNEDRPLTLYFALPVQAEGWTWWDDIATPRKIGGVGEFFYNPSTLQEPRVSPYPFCCVSGEREAISLETPPDMPRIQRMVYNPALQLLYIAYEVCLSPAATKQGQTAEFEFSIFRSDPKWGFRSTVEMYYAKYPGAFWKRVPREGGWGCWGTYAANPHIKDLGYQYHWGPDPRGGARTFAEAVRFDNECGVFSLPYIEWTNLHVTMEGYEQAANRDIMERIRYIADPERAEPLPRWQYCFPYSEQILGPDYDGWMRATFQAYLKSLIYGPEGLLYGGADRSEFGLLVAKYIPFNADPDIPGGAGEFFLTRYLPALEEYYAASGVRIDGFGWDNFYVRGNCFDYRREHFAYADEPLAFDTSTLEPVIVKDMATYELQRRLVAIVRGSGRYLMANQGVISAVPATLPLLDIFGYEWNITNTATYARTMARHKPVCSLPCADVDYRDPYVRDHLLYGCWPGGYYDTQNAAYLGLLAKYLPIIRRLCAAGWEPITLAHVDVPQVQIERFGGQGRELLFALKNRGPEAKAVRVTIDPELLPPGGLGATELVSGERLQVERGAQGTVNLEAPAGDVVVICIQPTHQ